MADETDEPLDPEEFLEWLLWVIATDGERFYPPAETAIECVDAQTDGDWDEVDRAYDEGYHHAMYINAVDLFVDARHAGFDPVEMVENEIERSRADGLDLDDIDWTWLEGGPYEWDVGED